MAKGKSRRGGQDTKQRQRKPEFVPVPSFNTGLTVETKPKAEQN